MPPDFDQQAQTLVAVAMDLFDEDNERVTTHRRKGLETRIFLALCAAYRAGMEHAAQLADGSCYGKEAAARIREEIE